MPTQLRPKIPTGKHDEILARHGNISETLMGQQQGGRRAQRSDYLDAADGFVCLRHAHGLGGVFIRQDLSAAKVVSSKDDPVDEVFRLTRTWNCSGTGVLLSGAKNGPKNNDETMKCEVITVLEAGKGSGLLHRKKQSRLMRQRGGRGGFLQGKSGCLQEEHRPEVGQSGLWGRGRVLEVEAAAQRQVPQQRRVSLSPPAAYRKTHCSLCLLPAHK